MSLTYLIALKIRYVCASVFSFPFSVARQHFQQMKSTICDNLSPPLLVFTVTNKYLSLTHTNKPSNQSSSSVSIDQLSVFLLKPRRPPPVFCLNLLTRHTGKGSLVGWRHGQSVLAGQQFVACYLSPIKLTSLLESVILSTGFEFGLIPSEQLARRYQCTHSSCCPSSSLQDLSLSPSPSL